MWLIVINIRHFCVEIVQVAQDDHVAVGPIFSDNLVTAIIIAKPATRLKLFRCHVIFVNELLPL